jgi:negative regulator of flagellin synthesis FlgM
MRIDAYMQVSQLYNASKPKRAMKAESTGASDTLEISDFGKDYQIAKQAVKNAPDIRESKIQEIQKQMAAGTYNVSIEDVADKLADTFLD